MDSTAVGVTRRQFFNRSILGFVGLGGSGFVASLLAFLWPRAGGTFGGKVDAGHAGDVLATLRDRRQP